MVITRKYILFFCLLVLVSAAALCLIHNKNARETAANAGFTIVLDAGHGTPDGGAVGVSGVEEKDINLAITEKIREILESKGCTVIMTREGDSGLQDGSAGTIREKKLSDMHKRREIMDNSNADLFLSIHMNSFSDPSVSGLHIFYDKAHPECEETAKRIQDEISAVTGAETHTVKTASDSLFLMKDTPIPTILAECGFLSNPDEEKKLKSERYQSKIAWAIAKAILNYTK